jgi:Ribosome biogenesis regulatory protein (RRS1)
MTDAQTPEPKLLAVNKQCDLGALLFEDCQSFADKSDKEVLDATRKNFCALFKELFELKKTQRVKSGGDDHEILEYTKALYSVDLPEPKVVVPRAKALPKEKPKTKWEKFREERGLPARKKRSRLVFDEITKDWVPRWGPNSKKKIEGKHEWLLVDNKGLAEGTDPFTIKRQEKKLELEKENMKRLKNDLYALKETHGKKSIKGVTEILANPTSHPTAGDSHKGDQGPQNN